MMKIGIFGNTNNYPFRLAQGLKALGHEVRLVLNRKKILHRPEGLYPEWAGAYPDWVFDCANNTTDEDIAYQTPAIDQAIRHLTDNLDLVILNDSGPALSSYLRSPHIVLLTGSDLSFHANFDSLKIRTKMWTPEFKRSPEGRRYLLNFSNCIARQRDGILAADLVCYPHRGLVPTGDQLLDDIGVQDQSRLMLLLSNSGLQPKPLPQNERLTILSGCRINYRPEQNLALSEIDFKGTDVLIQGFAQFIKSGGQGELRLVRKGKDLEAAIALIAALGIEAHIHWLDEMPLSQFYDEVAAADLVCDQFGTSFPAMVSFDAYALGRPVMANLRSEIFGQRFSESLPGFDASTPDEIAEHLILLERDHDLLAYMGLKSRGYAEQFLSPESMVKQLLDRLEGAFVPSDKN